MMTGRGLAREAVTTDSGDHLFFTQFGFRMPNFWIL